MTAHIWATLVVSCAALGFAVAAFALALTK